MRKLIIITAPSGAGKTTIVQNLLERIDNLDFSVSATNRKRRKHEKDGKDYYFMSTAEIQELIEKDAFVEWEEVYDQQYYGTLKSEVDRLWKENKAIVFDIEVKGATNIKRVYPDQSLAIFIKPPSPEILFERLRNRKTEDEESLRKRIARAAEELTYENKFDRVLVNDILDKALDEAAEMVRAFLAEED